MKVKAIKTVWIGLCLTSSFTFAAIGVAVAADPGRVVVALYYVAPGKHIDFLKWAANQDAVAKEAGVPASQWYAHQDGDSWDYVGIRPVTTPEQDKKTDELMKKRGMKTGLAAGVALRQYISRHTDTYALGPITAAELLKQAME
jgi:membrane-bound lytic murein transglycosylase B